MNLFLNLQDFTRQHRNAINTLCFLIVLLFAIRVRFFNFGKVSFLLLLVSLTLAITLNWFSLKEMLLFHKKFLFFLLVLFLWMWFCAFLSDYPSTTMVFSFHYSHYFIVLFCFLVLTYKNNNRKFYKLLLYFLELLGILGIVQYFYPNLWIFEISISVYPRISSLLQHPNPFGVLMSSGAILSLVLYKYKFISKSELYVSEGIFIVTSALAASRNELVIFSLGLFLLLILKYINLRTYILVNSLKAIAIFISPLSSSRIVLAIRYFLQSITGLKYRSDTSIHKQVASKATHSTDIAIHGRLELWDAAIHEIVKRPITGIGAGVFSEHIGSQVFPGRLGYHTHNLFLNFLVELGIPGLLLLLVLIYDLTKKTKFNNLLVTIPLILFLTSQLVDFFIDNVIFTTIELYFVAAAMNSSNEANKKLNPVSTFIG